MGRDKGALKIYQFRPSKVRIPRANTENVPHKPEPGEDPDEAIRGYTPEGIVLGINRLLQELETRGIRVADYDSTDRLLFRIKKIRNCYYFLAGPEDKDITE